MFGKNFYLSKLQELNLSIRAKPQDDMREQVDEDFLSLLPRPSRTPFLTRLTLNVYVEGGHPVISEKQGKFHISNIKKLRLRYLHATLETHLCFAVNYKEKFPNLKELDIRVANTDEIAYTMTNAPDKIEVLKLLGLTVADDNRRSYDAKAALGVCLPCK